MCLCMFELGVVMGAFVRGCVYAFMCVFGVSVRVCERVELPLTLTRTPLHRYALHLPSSTLYTLHPTLYTLHPKP